ncbi:hypothetical protein ACWG5P_32830 [Streptomyces prasinus]
MTAGRGNAAEFIARPLPEPHEASLGGELAHYLPVTVHADWVCLLSGHRIGWSDCYDSANILALIHKADLLLEPNGRPKPSPDHLTGEARERAERAVRHAA